jgi:hypothetical protein
VRHAAAAVLALVALAACGGDDDATRAADACVQAARNAAEAGVVIRYYEEGKLGPKSEIRRELTGFRTSAGRRLRFFDDRGRMFSWERMDRETRSTFLHWINNDAEVEAATAEARAEALERVDPDCD